MNISNYFLSCFPVIATQGNGSRDDIAVNCRRIINMIKMNVCTNYASIFMQANMQSLLII